MSTSSRQQASVAADSPAPKETGTVRRVLMLLSFLADHPGEPVNAVAVRLGLPRSTTHRLLAMLRADDFVLPNGDGSFSPGPEFYRIAGRVAASIPYDRLAQPLLQQLSAQFEETSIMAVLARKQLRMFYAATASPPDPMRYNIELNRLEPLVWGATARVLLAYLSAAEIDAAIARAEPSPQGEPAPARKDMLAALGGIRRQGHAVTFSHRTRSAVGIAVPFFDAEGEVVGDFGFLVPERRFSKQRLKPLLQGLQDAATAMSSQLGHTVPA
jgi:DNA-binding IclR family transcriptional regulator